MKSQFYNILLSAVFVCAASFAVSAQSGIPTDDKDSDKNDVSRTFNETLVKNKIDREKKDFNDMLKRGDEAIELSNQLEKSYEKNNRLSAEDYQKLERLEKILKKIRTELGAEGDDDPDDDAPKAEQPAKDQNAFQKLQSMTVDLADKLKKTTRFSISVAAVQSSNAILKMVKFLRLKK